jgi:hypothetical protein
METCHCLPKGQQLDIQLLLKDARIQLKGRTIYSHLLPNKRIISGVQFVELAEKDKAFLEEFLIDLGKSSKPRGMVTIKNINDELDDQGVEN